MTSQKIKDILEGLENMYPDANCELVHNSPYELLIATMLSAQCTDVRVNIVTKELFKKYNTAEKMIELDNKQLEEYIKTCGLYKSKAKNILLSSNILVDEFNGVVPKDKSILETFPGVGRKTANVVVSNAFGVPALAVDTHVFRVANRLGISKGKTPNEVEEELMKKIPKKYWIKVHHQIIWHGRRCCTARHPKCDDCNLKSYCSYYKTL